jgi:hypothetical protein
MPRHAPAIPSDTNIATNIRSESGIQRRERGGLSVAGSEVVIAGAAMRGVYPWRLRQ